MRTLRYEALDTMASPVKHVLKHVHRALVNIAPERSEKFDAEFAAFDLEILDDHRWVCDVQPAKNHIRLSSKVAEVLWASSLMYFRVYQVAQQHPGGTEIDIAASPELSEAGKLLTWALEIWFNGEQTPWPGHLPHPIASPEHASDLHVADELCLGALGFYLHHELSHIRLKHAKPDIDAERDADSTAAAWILDGVDEEDSRFVKRVICLAVALMAIIAKGIHTGAHDGVTHPRDYDRLINVLEQHVENPDHIVWFFVATVLSLHGQNAGRDIETPESGFASPKAVADAYAELLSHDS